MTLIYRRLALLAGASAQLVPLARGWEVVIKGHIGRYAYMCGEYYRTRRPAAERRSQINFEKRALVVSVDEILYPLSLVVARFDRDHQPVPLPATPPLSQPIQAFSSVKDLYGRPQLRPRN